MPRTSRRAQEQPEAPAFVIPAPRLVLLSELRPAAWNPRLIRDVRFENLCRSIAKRPGFLWRRPVLAMADGTVYAGNMRWRALDYLWRNGAFPPRVDDEGDPIEEPINWRAVAAEAGLTEEFTAPAIVEDVPETVAKELAVLDNNAWGEWSDQELAELLYTIGEAQVDLTTLGFDDKALTQLLDLVGVGDGTTPFGDFEPAGVNGLVEFRFGTISGQVSNAVYELFQQRYRSAQANGTIMLDDLLRQWLASTDEQ